jgi:hypothetical protein
MPEKPILYNEKYDEHASKIQSFLINKQKQTTQKTQQKQDPA